MVSSESRAEAWLRDPGGQFREWQRPRPLLGGALLCLGALLIGWVPVQFTTELLLIGGTFTMLGLFFASLVAFCGVGALAKPEFAPVFGAFGVAFSTLSLFGALGGLLIGMVVGTAGGVLCYAWDPPADVDVDVKSLAATSGFVWQEAGEFVWGEPSGFIWQTDEDGDPDVDLSVDEVEPPDAEEPEVDPGDLDEDEFKL